MVPVDAVPRIRVFVDSRELPMVRHQGTRQRGGSTSGIVGSLGLLQGRDAPAAPRLRSPRRRGRERHGDPELFRVPLYPRPQSKISPQSFPRRLFARLIQAPESLAAMRPALDFERLLPPYSHGTRGADRPRRGDAWRVPLGVAGARDRRAISVRTPYPRPCRSTGRPPQTRGAAPHRIQPRWSRRPPLHAPSAIRRIRVHSTAIRATAAVRPLGVPAVLVRRGDQTFCHSGRLGRASRVENSGGLGYSRGRRVARGFLEGGNGLVANRRPACRNNTLNAHSTSTTRMSQLPCTRRALYRKHYKALKERLRTTRASRT
ncbi:hypothetical protein C8R46DRAFT_447640 [Mycena filopes]|nr:hypothetical protein C8R46DRAFT_447640 [Mycena filopes]